MKTVDNEPAIVADGKFAYKAPDGTDIAVSYTADENGYRPEGAHIPAIPAAIARALEYIAAHPEQNGPWMDGSTAMHLDVGKRTRNYPETHGNSNLFKINL